MGVPTVLLLGASQAILPRLAVQQVRSRLKPYGALQHVSVSAFPALELLWGKAERASATARSLSIGERQMTKLIWEGRGVRDTDLSVGALTLRVAGLPNGLLLHDVTARKRGDRLSMEATISQAELDASSPAGFRMRLLPSDPGTMRVLASGSLFGIAASVQALAAPSGGRLVAQPLGIPFGQFVALTVFSDPHLYLDGVSAVPLESGGQGRWRLTMNAHLH